MGLDITAYEKVSLRRAKAVEEWTDADYDEGDRVGRTRLYVVPGFSETADGLVDGVYEVSGVDHGFRAGSYGGYNAWRNQLATLIGTTPERVWEDPQPGPFVELINNSDCEGIIGPVSSAKLARDFAEWQERADAFLPGDPWFHESYAHWRKAFEIAANGGVVKFH